MIGPGYKCDSCKKAVILPQDASTYRVSDELPEGWFRLGGPMESSAQAMTPRHEFCSVKCVAAWTHATIEAQSAATS